MTPDAGSVALAAEIHGLLLARRETFAVAESLTGGLLGATVTAVPGVSESFRGGVVAYATELKTELLGVPADLLVSHGPVDPLVAAAMAAGVRSRLRATYGLATTGVAGPDSQDGHEPGEVYLGLAGGDPLRLLHRRVDLGGDRADVRAGAVRAALVFLRELVADGNSSR